MRADRRGTTLVEILVALGIGSLTLGLIFQLLSSGTRMFASGMGRIRGPEAAVFLLTLLEDDIGQTVQIPGDPRPPLAIDRRRSRLALYRPDPAHSDPRTVVGEPVVWELTGREGDIRHPKRNGRVLKTVPVASWTMELIEPHLDSRRPGWFLALRLELATGGLFNENHVAHRLIHLPQPSSNFLHFPVFGEELYENTVQLMKPPPFDTLFEALEPPDPLSPNLESPEVSS